MLLLMRKKRKKNYYFSSSNALASWEWSLCRVSVNVTLVRRKYKMSFSSNLVSQIKTFLMRDGVEDEPYYF